MTFRKNYRCARKEITLEPTKYDSIVTNSKATSGTSQCLGKNNEIMTINRLYTTTGQNIDIMSNSMLYHVQLTKTLFLLC